MNWALSAAGILALLGSAVHGAGGQIVVLRRLGPGAFPPTRFGGPRMTRAMIWATWHITTAAFLSVGLALLLSGLVLEGDAARAIALVAAGTWTAFAAVVVGLGAVQVRRPRALLLHPGPALLTTTAALAWLGAS